MTERKAEEIIAQTVAEMIERRTFDLMVASFGGDITSTQTTANSNTLTLPKLEQMFAECEKLRRNLQRTSVTFQVDLSHTGPMLQSEHPTEGTTIECSFAQAQEVHREIPLIFVEAISIHAARFRPAHRFDFYITKYLPLPPFEAP